MVVWLIQYLIDIGELSSGPTNEYEEAGAVIGTAIGTSLILVIWALGAIILGIATGLTKPRK